MVLSLVMTFPVLFTLSIHTVFLYMMCVPFDCQSDERTFRKFNIRKHMTDRIKT